jgi:hypothetical protein
MRITREYNKPVMEITENGCSLHQHTDLATRDIERATVEL